MSTPGQIVRLMDRSGKKTVKPDLDKQIDKTELARAAIQLANDLLEDVESGGRGNTGFYADNLDSSTQSEVDHVIRDLQYANDRVTKVLNRFKQMKSV